MELDHVIVAVRDLDTAAATFSALLGVPVGLRSEHPVHETRNALLLFRGGPYLELLEVPRREGAPFVTAVRRAAAARGEGLVGLALTAPSMGETIDHLRALGYDVPAVEEGSAVNADGRVRRWRTALLPTAIFSGVPALLVEHYDWDWRAELRPREDSGRVWDGAAGIHHLAIDVAEADDSSRRWEEALGLRLRQRIVSERMGALVNVHPAGAATLESVSAIDPTGAVAARIADRGLGPSSVAFEVNDIDRAVATARATGALVGDPAPGVLPNSSVARVVPSSAANVAVQFLQFL